MEWTRDRIEEFDMLDTLLSEIAMINNGSNCLGRIAKCIETAEVLRRTDWDSPHRISFISFIRQQITLPERTKSEPRNPAETGAQ